MDKRQKKKIYKQTIVKVRKLHLNRGDVILLRPDLTQIDIETTCELMKMLNESNAFEEASFGIVPCDIKQLESKEEAQLFVDKLQELIKEVYEK